MAGRARPSLPRRIAMTTTDETSQQTLAGAEAPSPGCTFDGGTEPCPICPRRITALHMCGLLQDEARQAKTNDQDNVRPWAGALTQSPTPQGANRQMSERDEKVRAVLAAATEPLGPTEIARRIGEHWCTIKGRWPQSNVIVPVLRRIGAVAVAKGRYALQISDGHQQGPRRESNDG